MLHFAILQPQSPIFFAAIRFLGAYRNVAKADKGGVMEVGVWHQNESDIPFNYAFEIVLHFQ